MRTAYRTTARRATWYTRDMMPRRYKDLMPPGFEAMCDDLWTRTLLIEGQHVLTFPRGERPEMQGNVDQLLEDLQSAGLLVPEIPDDLVHRWTWALPALGMGRRVAPDSSSAIDP